jgi:1,2-diacylglycerol 3-beta-glucosyltransferase
VLAGALELFVVALGLAYFLALTVGGLWAIQADRESGSHRRSAAAQPGRGTPHRPVPAGRRNRVSGRWERLRAQVLIPDEQAPNGASVHPADCVVYFLIPCLNEEVVIEQTVRELLTDRRARVVVVDDASDDLTGELARAIDPERVSVVTRILPDARKGKGPALNAGLSRVLTDAAGRGIAPSRVIVCVMDADGRLSPGALDPVLPLFADGAVGGVQLPVRIRNRGTLLTTMQDVEFWGVCAIAQLGRIATGTVSLGGNGQFTRLSALLQIGTSPWQAQLTEDLDLALALAARGWRLVSTPRAYVSQQGLTGLRALIRQRSRWYQGHMQAIRWMRPLWESRRLSHLGMLELTMYLLVPWLLVLPWSIVFNYDLALIGTWIAGWTSGPLSGADLVQRAGTILFWYGMTCIPIWMAGYLYSRQERKAGLFRALLLGHLLLLGNYITYAACWRALYRIVTGAHGWQKTQRQDEQPSTRPMGRRRPVPTMTAMIPWATTRRSESPVAGGYHERRRTSYPLEQAEAAYRTQAQQALPRV